VRESRARRLASINVIHLHKKNMNNIFRMFTLFFLLIPGISGAQDEQAMDDKKGGLLYGFVRAGFFGSKDVNDHKPYVSSAFSDLGLKLLTKDDQLFKAFADLRFRYGTEFLKPVTRFDIREAYVTINGKWWDLSAGQKIVKWGRADFTNPTSKLSPKNLVSRSPDREDMDMANLLMSARIYPSSFFSLEADIVPYYRSSVLVIDPITLPDYVKINQIESLITDKKMFSYGLKADLHLKGADLGVSWFDGYDPMPGTALTGFRLDLSGPVPVPYTELTMAPYKIRNLGLDFETTAGSLGLRGEAAWTLPYESFKTHEYVPCQELKWVAGIDRTAGNWRFTLEYSGKSIIGFVPATADPLIGTQPDLAKLAVLLSTPGFNMENYVRQQVGAFNRLYNYQLKRSYHSAGFRVETDLSYGKLTPSVFTLYNFTSRDLFVNPELIYKPLDGLAISIGGEFYSGPKGSIYDIIDEFMNCARFAIRVDF
jgi:hypothetical protein